MKRERSQREREREDGPLPVTRTRILSFGREEKRGGGAKEGHGGKHERWC